MSLLASAHIFVASVCVVVSLLHITIFLRQTELKINFIFAIMALCCGSAALLDLGMLHAKDVETFTAFLKLTNSFQVLLWIAFIWFIQCYTGNNRRWAILLVTGIYILSGLLNLIFDHGILFAHIDHLDSVILPWGERIASAVGPSNPLRLLPDVAWFFLLAYALDSCIRMHRQGHKRRALFLGISLFACLGIGYFHGTLIDLGLVSPPGIWLFTFLALIVLMSGALVDDVVRVRVLSRQLAVQEAKFTSLVNLSTMVVIGLDTSGRINFVNPHFSAITGFSREEVVGRPLVDLVLPDDKGEVAEKIARIMADEDFRERSMRALVAKDNTFRKVHWSHVRLRDARGAVTGSLSIGEDVTDVEDARQALADEKSRMDTILSALNTGLALINPDLTVAWINDHTAKILPWNELVGKTCYVAAANRSEPCDGCGALKAFKDGKIHETERQSPVDGKWHHIVSLPIIDKNGRVVNVLESVTDITERKQAEIARDSALEELQALRSRLEDENISLRKELTPKIGFEDIIGNSNAMLYLLERVRQVAPTGSTVLIQGETGVGKELIAGAIHRLSDRADKAFLKVNCAALSPSLVESELFGHEAGAYTGADKMRRGRFELSNGGSLLLDEIGELSPAVQVKLLRVLQEGQFERVGGNATLSVDVRIIATTNRDLEKEVAQGRFRADLYYRLKVYPVTVPPLRKRKEDIPLLVWHFLKEINQRVGKNIDSISEKTIRRLAAMDFPGNVRELKNVLERAVITSQGNVLQWPVTGEPEEVSTASSGHDTDELESLDTVQRNHILRVLHHTGWRIEGKQGAADILQVKPSTLRHRMRTLGIERKQLNN
jgi:PAS domain S-box-containing protein